MAFFVKYCRTCILFIKMFFRKLSFKLSKLKVKYLFLTLFIYWILYFCGAFTHFFERDFYTEFSYPLEGDVQQYIEQLKNGGIADHTPINVYNYTFLSDCHDKCKRDYDDVNIRLVYIVKSNMPHFSRRSAIRKTWGFERRFSDVYIRTVFILGTHPTNITLQSMVMQEQEKFRDIIQADFIDNYYNNTIKTMMGFKWARKFCPNSRFYFFSDDDMYVSTKNVLRFIRNPTRYPQYLEDPVASLTQGEVHQQFKRRTVQQVLDFELPDDVRLYAGKVMVRSPLRHHFSKWYVSLEEYPFHLWPPYVTAAAYILSREALNELFLATLFTKHFRFDDIFLAIAATKAGLEPLHNDEFHFERPSTDHPSTYQYIIASHGFSDPQELLRFWELQREAGNA